MFTLSRPLVTRSISNISKLFDAPSSDWAVDSAGETFLITEGAVAATSPIVIDNGLVRRTRDSQ